jgi:hypothetical protein
MMNQVPAVSQSPYAEHINAIHAFMNNTTLRGVEVESYAQAFNWAQSVLVGELVVIPAAAFDTLTKAATAHQIRMNAEKELAEAEAKAATDSGEPELDPVD